MAVRRGSYLRDCLADRQIRAFIISAVASHGYSEQSGGLICLVDLVLEY